MPPMIHQEPLGEEAAVAADAGAHCGVQGARLSSFFARSDVQTLVECHR
jgi:hypothetical protein